MQFALSGFSYEIDTGVDARVYPKAFHGHGPPFVPKPHLAIVEVSVKRLLGKVELYQLLEVVALLTF